MLPLINYLLQVCSATGDDGGRQARVVPLPSLAGIVAPLSAECHVACCYGRFDLVKAL